MQKHRLFLLITATKKLKINLLSKSYYMAKPKYTIDILQLSLYTTIRTVQNEKKHWLETRQTNKKNTIFYL